MKIKKLLSVFFAFSLVVGCLALTGCGEGKTTSTHWGDNYRALIESGEERDYEGYADLKATLDTIREESGATYVYALTPLKNEKIAFDGDAKGPFAITVDGSIDPDDWAEEYDWEIQFQEAWSGTPAAARSAWEDNDEGTEFCWSAFAPVYDSEGQIVCLLGIDYPAPILSDFPEWDRDNDDRWNGMHEEITVNIPAEIQSLIDEVIALADKYANQLSK